MTHERDKAHSLMETYRLAISVGARFAPWPASAAAEKNAAKLEASPEREKAFTAISLYGQHLLRNPPPSRDTIIRPHNFFGVASRWREWYPEDEIKQDPERDKTNGEPQQAGPERDKANIGAMPPGADRTFVLDCVRAARSAGLIDPAKLLYAETVALCARQCLRDKQPTTDKTRAIEAVLAAATARAEWLRQS